MIGRDCFKSPNLSFCTCRTVKTNNANYCSCKINVKIKPGKVTWVFLNIETVLSVLTVDSLNKNVPYDELKMEV